MGQCFGTDCAGLCPRWSYKQQRGLDRYTKFAPKNQWKYADEHLLSEIQDPRSDDELDFSDINNELSPKRTIHTTHDRPERDYSHKNNKTQQQQQQYTTVTIGT